MAALLAATDDHDAALAAARARMGKHPSARTAAMPSGGNATPKPATPRAGPQKTTGAQRAAPRRRQTRALLFIALCFIGSAGARVGEVGMAAAQGAGASEAAFLPPDPTAPAPAAPSAASADRPAALPSGEVNRLMAAIRERTELLDAREARIAERESLLEVAEARVRNEIERLQQAEQDLARTLALADGASERDVTHLVGVYEAMKPKDAAQIFNAMAPNFAAGFMARMRPDAAAAIMAAMPVDAAHAITAVMAGRSVGLGQPLPENIP